MGLSGMSEAEGQEEVTAAFASKLSEFKVLFLGQTARSEVVSLYYLHTFVQLAIDLSNHCLPTQGSI